jgi:imidazolonepropionase
MIPYIKKKKLAEYCDVFCEEGYFNPKETRKILKKALGRKLKIRLHADEFKHS